MKASIVYFMVMCLLVFSLATCADDDDDDNDDAVDDDNDDAADDDDTTGDDDDDDDDDDNDDNDDNDDDDDNDDTGDDDTGDDDDDTPTGPTRLFIIGYSAGIESSWLQTDKGWQYAPIPEGRCLMEWADRYVEATATWNGQKAWVAWNCSFKGYPAGHDWKVFTPDVGWHDAVMDAMPLAWIWRIHPVGPQHVWFLAEFNGNSMSKLVENQGLTSSEVTFAGDPLHYRDLSFSDADHGLAVGTKLGNIGVLGWYDADQTEPWTAEGMPAGHEDQYFYKVEMTSPDHGWAVNQFYWLFEYDDGQWTHMNMPSGCEGLQVSTFAANGDDVVALPYAYGDEDRRFAVRRGGQWSCREAPDLGEDVRPRRAIMYRDGTTYIYLTVDNEPGMLQVTADDITTVELPGAFSMLLGLHAIGPNAPWVSN